MKQLEARKLNQLFNTFVREQRDKKRSNYDAQIIVELTGPEFVGGATRDTNGDNLTMQLLTKTYTTENVLFVASSKYNSIQIYFRSQAHERGDKHVGVVVVFKDKKGERQSLTVSKHHYGDKDDALSTVRNRLGFGYSSDRSQELSELSESITDDLVSYANMSQENIDAMRTLGVQIETVMEYSQQLNINPKFIKRSKNTVTFGWMSFGTYSSHPMTLKITKSLKGVDLVRLSDIGAEESGYYDHHNRHTCRPEHAPAFKKFAASFKRNLKKKGL